MYHRTGGLQRKHAEGKSRQKVGSAHVVRPKADATAPIAEKAKAPKAEEAPKVEEAKAETAADETAE